MYGLSIWSREGAQPSTEPDVVWCTDHMCPIQVHWHIKNNYRDHWRVKLTISNYNYGRNYSDWTLVVQHPGFSQTTTTYSFNSTVLSTVGVPGIHFVGNLETIILMFELIMAYAADLQGL